MQIGAIGSAQHIAVIQTATGNLGGCQVVCNDLTGTHVDRVLTIDQRPDGVGIKGCAVFKPLRRRDGGKDRAVRRAQQDAASGVINTSRLAAHHPDARVEQDVALFSHHTHPTAGGGDVFVQGNGTIAGVQADVARGGADAIRKGAAEVQHIDVTTNGAQICAATGLLTQLVHIDRAKLLNHDGTGGDVCIPKIHSFNLNFERVRYCSDSARRCDLQACIDSQNIHNTIGLGRDATGIDDQRAVVTGAHLTQGHVPGGVQAELASTRVDQGVERHRHGPRACVKGDHPTRAAEVTLLCQGQADCSVQGDGAAARCQGRTDVQAATGGAQADGLVIGINGGVQGGSPTGQHRDRTAAGAVNLVNGERVFFIDDDVAAGHDVEAADLDRGVGCTRGPGSTVAQGDCARGHNGQSGAVGQVLDPDITAGRHNAHVAHGAGDAVDDDVAVSNDVHLAARHGQRVDGQVGFGRGVCGFNCCVHALLNGQVARRGAWLGVERQRHAADFGLHAQVSASSGRERTGSQLAAQGEALARRERDRPPADRLAGGGDLGPYGNR